MAPVQVNAARQPPGGQLQQRVAPVQVNAPLQPPAAQLQQPVAPVQVNVPAQPPAGLMQQPVAPVELNVPVQQPAGQMQEPGPNNNDEGKCQICFTNFINARIACNHCYCYTCLETLKNDKKGCPNCRYRFRVIKRLFVD